MTTSTPRLTLPEAAAVLRKSPRWLKDWLRAHRGAVGAMKRAAIYARYSTDLQSDKSIDDQVALCRMYAARNGLKIVATFADRATSGASLHGRTGMLALLAGARERGSR